MRLLLDEHISPALVGRLAARGFYAQSVPHVGLAGAPDKEVWAYALKNESVVVTANARHFLTLAAHDVHPGLIILRESGLTREEQWERLEPVIRFVAAAGNRDFLLNKIIEVAAPGEFLVREIQE
jgi:predicted nuclease of predicted toxin-antitoxin system